MTAGQAPELPVGTQQFASYIAMVVRNAMEDFHCQHLNDEQMRELNPIIRNAICTALHAFNHDDGANAAARFVDYNIRMIPGYWEKPELLDGYVRMWGRSGDASGAEGPPRPT